MKESTNQSVEYASWSDPQKWMERMKGTRWVHLHQDYRKEYEKAVAAEGDLVSQIEHELKDRESSIPPTKLHGCSYQQIGKQSFLWWFTKDKRTVCTDLDIGDDGWVWYVKDTDSGDESYLSMGHAEEKKNGHPLSVHLDPSSPWSMSVCILLNLRIIFGFVAS